MNHPSTSICERFPASFVTTLGIGLAAASYVAFANIGAANFGVLPSIKKVVSKTDAPNETSVKLFSFFYRTASVHMASSAVISGLMFIGSSFLYNQRPQRGFLNPKNLLFASGLTMISIIPYTLLFMLPTNRKLLRMARKLDQDDQQHKDESSASLSPSERAQVPELLTQWTLLNFIRYSTVGIAWSMAITAVFRV